MKKSTKVVATIIAVTLVISAMIIAIYAATAGNFGINANVSWTAQAGVDLEFWAKVSGGSETKEIAKTSITPSTTNANANIIGDLSCNFSDTSEDGVNNPNAIEYVYYVKNKSLTPLNIRVTKTPAQAEEAGTSPENHTPKVVLNSETEGTNTLTAVLGSSGYNLGAGDVFAYTVTLSLASGGEGTINADTGIATSFDAGVTFNFAVGGSSQGTIITTVDGVGETTVNSSSLVGQTLGTYLSTLQTPEYFTGWFFDENLTKAVSDDYLNVELKESSISSLYGKTASTTGLTFELDSDTDTYMVSGDSTTPPSGEVIIPNMYNGKKVTILGSASSGSGDLLGSNKGINATSSVSSAFENNTNITSVVLPNTIEYIKDSAFSGCENLVSIYLPDSLKKIGSSVFSGCGISSIVIPSSVEEINYVKMQNLLLSGNDSKPLTKSIGTNKELGGLGGGSSYKGVDTVNYYHIFMNCPNLISITVASGNTKYDSRNNCNGIIASNNNALIATCKNTVIPKTIENIVYFAFQGCKGLTSVVIPSSVESISHSGSNIRDTDMAESMSIQALDNLNGNQGQLFAYCNELTSIYVESGNRYFDSRENCNAIIEKKSNTILATCSTSKIPSTVEYIGASAFKDNLGITSISIPSGVKVIGTQSFANCSNLTKIFIPSSVTSIISDQYAPFYGCSSVKIYCEASSQPTGWGTYWNNYDSSKTNKLTPTWNYSREQFDSIQNIL